MGLVSLKELLNDSKDKKYGVFATNAFTFEMAETIIEAAEEKKSPVILMLAQDLFSFLDPKTISSCLLEMIDKSQSPVVLHLDHGKSFDVVANSMKLGFNSVMYDGSSKTLEENMRITKKLKELALPLNICLEGEVGHVRGLEGKDGSPDDQKISVDDYTKLEDAIRFVEETGVDALAVAVGTIHGKFKSKPDLDFDRIGLLKDSVDVPLVLHGSSGLSDDDFKEAIRRGITKINYFTGVVDIATRKAKELIKEEGFSYLFLNKDVLKSVKEEIMRIMDVFGSSGMA